MPQALSDIHTEEVSLVRHGANRRRYFLRKAEDGQHATQETRPTGSDRPRSGGRETQVMPIEKLTAEALVAQALLTAVPQEDAYVAQLAKSGLSEHAQAALRSVSRLLYAVADELPAEVTKADTADAADLPDAHPLQEPRLRKRPGMLRPRRGLLAGRRRLRSRRPDPLDYPAPALLLQKAEPGLLPQAPLANRLLKSHQALQQEVTEVRKSLAEERTLRAIQSQIRKAEQEFRHLPITPQKLGTLLHHLGRVLSPQQATDLHRVFKASDAAFAQVSQPADTGVRVDDTPAPGAVGTIRQRAQQIVKADNVSYSDALSRLFAEDEQLYELYRQETQQKV